MAGGVVPDPGQSPRGAGSPAMCQTCRASLPSLTAIEYPHTGHNARSSPMSPHPHRTTIQQGAPVVTAPPNTDPQHGDPVAVILARMEVKLDNALTEQGKHGTVLDSHGIRLADAENRLTKLETTWEAEQVAVRVSALERRVWAASGVAAFLGGGGAVLVTRFVGV